MWNRGVELEGRIITVTLGNNRFCWCKGASHRSNHVYLVADLLRGDFYQILCLENTTERNSDKVLTTSLRSRIDTSIKIFKNPQSLDFLGQVQTSSHQPAACPGSASMLTAAALHRKATRYPPGFWKACGRTRTWHGANSIQFS